MRPSLWFCVPAHGRHEMAAICLRQLARTCDSLQENGIDATAVVVADRDNLKELNRRTDWMIATRENASGRFGSVVRDNQYLSRRFNDAIQAACDPAVNPRPADYVVPIGTDDFIDWRILVNLPRPNQVVGFQHLSFVREDGLELTKTFLNYAGGCGMRIYPRHVVAKLGYRPADEDRKRGCDTSILTNIRAAVPNVQVVHVETDPRQIVDWKTAGQQLNEYDQVKRRHCRGGQEADPFVELADVFPAEALDEMSLHYSRGLVAA